ncbi:hypothetical protein Pcinc_010383 [Petrolisthes cinctipes]|uniref:Aldehyde oxidase n=1 Tax=Petrolisthes cinctipes TaxID=88211 RepID=A0AAE1KXF6_PETCI|nr:hypothetical protein Pcinc_010383 [Petrolisthes cinctipes]
MESPLEHDGGEENNVPDTLQQQSISLVINDHIYTVGSNIPPWTRLVDFIREQARLPGTKVLCREGGCGLCTVVATVPDHEKPGQEKTFSVHACQALVYACAGWRVETIEQLGTRFDSSYHPLQRALHGFYGTQCGFCSPGMIMTIYGQLKSGHPITSAKVEESLDGNICRCTGYRPILDAFKSQSVDADEQLKCRLVDIEEVYKGHCKKKKGSGCGGCCKDMKKDVALTREQTISTTEMGQWYRPTSLIRVYSILKNLRTKEKFHIAVGNTGQGVFKDDGPYSVYISTVGIKDLYSTRVGSTSAPVVLGANVSLTRAIEVFRDAALESPGAFAHLDIIAKHWQFVANVSVRNIGSWAGNLMMKHSHRGFQSDIYLTLLAAGAELTLGHAADASTSHINLEQFLVADMSRSIILSVSLPPALPNTKFRTFKITPRAVNAHAYVNACFRMEVDIENDYEVTSRPTILFGGINPSFIHAANTEEFLIGRKLNDNATIVEAAKILGSEVKPDNHPQDASPKYRAQLAQALLFKTVIGFLDKVVGVRVRSAGPVIDRPLSSGKQSFDMKKEEEVWPVGEPLPKLESAAQISGEATYLDDVPYLPNELHAALVLTTQANAKIKFVDATEALKMNGVVNFVDASDIPGQNSFVVEAGPYPDPVFVEERCLYAGQPVGVVVAEDRNAAICAAKLVKVEYEDIQRPVLTIKEAIKAGRVKVGQNVESFRAGTSSQGDVEGTMKTVPHKVSGELSQGTQYHFHMEALAARVIPTEEGYDVFSTSQWITETQSATAQVLNIPANSINVSVRRLGGAFGSKISRQNLVSTAAAVAARKLQRPVRLVVDLNTNMTCAGWREPYCSKYEVGFDDAGKLLALKVELYSDVGHVPNEPSVGILVNVLQNVYYIPNLDVTPHIVTTDTAANTWCRSPVERNVVKDDIIPLLKVKAAYRERMIEVEQYNQDNRWKKRGLSIMPARYTYVYLPEWAFRVQVTIYQHDGTVAVSHGGVMGQGINTKVAQVAAYVLGVPLNQVKIKATETMIGANSYVTGAFLGSDLCAHGVKVACTALHQRLEEVKTRMKAKTRKEPTWQELVKKCHSDHVDLTEHYWTAAKEHPQSYEVWSACCLEIEVDILTGMYMIRRADIIQDCGRSMNPFLDVGQVEGAFLMGIGLFTTELVKYDPATGQKLSNGTWEYKPPTALDIPADLRVTLLPNAMHPKGVLGSKATGEPPFCLAYSVVTGLRHAITAFRTDENGDDSWFEMDVPLTVEKVHQLCGINPDHHFKLE